MWTGKPTSHRFAVGGDKQHAEKPQISETHVGQARGDALVPTMCPRDRGGTHLHVFWLAIERPDANNS